MGAFRTLVSEVNMVLLDTRFKEDYLNVDFKADSSTPTTTKVRWKLRDQPYSDKPFPAVSYNLYFNEVPNQQFIKLNDKPITTPIFTHNTPRYTKYPRAYYIIEAVDAKGNKKSSHLKDLYPDFDRVGDKMSKTEVYYSMAKHGERIDNEPIWIYARKGFGTPVCKACSVAGMGALKSKCPKCLGTGLEEGYYDPPVLAYMTYQSAFQRNETHTGPRLSQEMMNTVNVAAEFCMINPYDYIREANFPFRLYCVQAVTATEYNTRPVVLFLSLQLEESGHPLYEKDMPSIQFPKNVYYNNCRELYEKTISTIGKDPEDPFA